MASTKIKTAYSFFLVFFSIWVTVLWSTCFPSGAWANPVRFPNILMLTLFMVSGSIAAISCAVIGIEYLGISFRSKHGDSIQTVGNQRPAIRECRTLVVQESLSDTANIEKLQEPSAVGEPEETEQDVFVILPTEEKETTQEFRQKSARWMNTKARAQRLARIVGRLAKPNDLHFRFMIVFDAFCFFQREGCCKEPIAQQS